MKKIHSLLIILCCLLLSSSLFSVSASTLQMGDKIPYSFTYSWDFTDQNKKESSESVKGKTTITISGFNTTHINHTTYIDLPYYTAYAYANNGGWYFRKGDGRLTYSYITEENITVDPRNVYFDLFWMDYPLWNNETCGNEFQSWNTSSYYYLQRFDYFDLVDDIACDELSIMVTCPLFVNNVSEFIGILEDQWNAYAFGNVGNLPTFIWNTSIISWTSFKYNLFPNVAYSPKVTKNDSYGNVLLVEFTPAWVGNYWYPNIFKKWNGTQWINRVDPLGDSYSSTSNPIIPHFNGIDWIYNIDPSYRYFSKRNLNIRQGNINDSKTFTDLNMEFSVNELSLEITIQVEDFRRYTYHNDGVWSENRRNNGSEYVIEKINYNSDKGILKSHERVYEYNFGEKGLYKESVNGKIIGGGLIPGYEFSIIFIAILYAICIRKRRNNE